MYAKLLLAVDDSDAAERAINATGELASLSDGEVWVLHVREHEFFGRGGFFPTETAAQALSVVEHAAQELDDAGVKAHYEVRNGIYGRTAHQIVAAAHAHGADVIVMGSTGHNGLASLMRGNTAHEVIHLSDRPVLVVR